jgi:hypothetical protein
VGWGQVGADCSGGPPAHQLPPMEEFKPGRRSPGGKEARGGGQHQGEAGEAGWADQEYTEPPRRLLPLPGIR